MDILAIPGNQAVYDDLKKLLTEGSAIAFLGAESHARARGSHAREFQGVYGFTLIAAALKTCGSSSTLFSLASALMTSRWLRLRRGTCPARWVGGRPRCTHT